MQVLKHEHGHEKLFCILKEWETSNGVFMTLLDR